MKDIPKYFFILRNNGFLKGGGAHGEVNIVKKDRIDNVFEVYMRTSHGFYPKRSGVYRRCPRKGELNRRVVRVGLREISNSGL